MAVEDNHLEEDLDVQAVRVSVLKSNEQRENIMKQLIELTPEENKTIMDEVLAVAPKI
jgi:hypothetical protein